MKMNCDIRAAMARSDLRQYQIAAALGISESRYSSKLRKELPDEEKSKILRLSNNCHGRRFDGIFGIYTDGIGCGNGG